MRPATITSDDATGAPLNDRSESAIKFRQLKEKLGVLGYDMAHLETSDQNVGYGFVVKALYQNRRGTPVSHHELDRVNASLEELGLLDIDWDGPVGEDPHGYAWIDLRS